MPVAAPIVLSALTAADTVKTSSDARKGRKQQLEQTDRIAAETAAQQPQNEQQAQYDAFNTKRRRRSPGFTDNSTATAPMTGGTQGAYLGQ